VIFLDHFASVAISILRLEKSFFDILIGFYHILPFILQKVVPSLIEVEKDFVKKVARGSKKSVFLSWFQKGAELLC
jgi:hypothetical protein